MLGGAGSAYSILKGLAHSAQGLKSRSGLRAGACPRHCLLSATSAFIPERMKVSVLTIDTPRMNCYPVGMPRKLRIRYPRAIRHVMNRRVQGKAVLRDDEDRQKLL